MKISDKSPDCDQTTTLPTASWVARLAIVAGWTILAFLLTLAATQPAQAEELPAGQLPSTITMSRGEKYGRKTVVFSVDTTHSVFEMNDRFSGKNCYKNKIWFEHYKVDIYDPGEKIRQSGEYTIRHRDSSKGICIRVTFEDFREAMVPMYAYGPFYFEEGREVVVKPKPDPDKVIEGVVNGTVGYAQNLELPRGSKMIVEVLDATSRAGDSTLMANKIVTNLGNQPHSFQIKYKTKLANQRDSYEIDVKVVDKNGVLLLTQQTPVYATTDKNPASVRVDLSPTPHLAPTDPTQQDSTNDDAQEPADNPQPQKGSPVESTAENTPPQKPLPLQTKKALNPSDPKRHEPEVDSKNDNKPVKNRQEPKADESQPPEPLLNEQEPTQPPPPVKAEGDSTAKRTNEQPETTKLQNQTGPSIIWLGGYVALVLVAGAVSLTIIQRKNRRR